ALSPPSLHDALPILGLVLVRAKAAGLDCLRLTFQRAFGGTLHVEIERGVHLQALLVKLLPELSVELLTHPLDEVGRGLARGNARSEEHTSELQSRGH